MKWLPNALTILRCVLAFIVGWAILAFGTSSILPFLLFVIVAATDFLDGYAARKLNAVTAFGAWLDPVADKLLVAISLLALCYVLNWWWAIVIPTIAIIGRDILITWLRSARPVSLPVTRLAKWKTALEMIGIAGMLICFSYVSPIVNLLQPSNPETLSDTLDGNGVYLMYMSLLLIALAAALSLYTGFLYVRAAFSKTPH